MDMNQLLYHHQLAKLNAQHSRSAKSRNSNFDLAGYYAGRIMDWRRAKGLPEAGWPHEQQPAAVNP